MDDYGPFSCSLDAGMDVVGGKWKALILWELREGPRRFNALQRSLPGVSQKVLTQQLKELERYGVVDRRSFNEVPPRVEYSMTPQGERLLVALEPLADWADANFDRILQASPRVTEGS